MAVTSGGDRVVRALKSAGVDTIFSIHGAHIDTIFQACLDQNVRIVDTRHEAAAGHAAEGYARAGNRLGVALVTAGGGFTNVMTPIADAYLDRTPVLFITGSGALRDAETNTLQAGIDQVAMARPVTKWAHQATITDNIPRLIAQAARIAQSAPRGPVLLDIPWDVLMNRSEEGALMRFPTVPNFGGTAPAESVERISEVLASADRPVVIVGGEVARGGGGEALRAFLAQTGIPAFADFEGLSLLTGSPQCFGLLQNLYTFDERTGRPDAVLLLGVRFGLHTSHGSGLLIPHAAKVLQVDSDPREIGRLQPVEIGIAADAAEAIKAIQAASTKRRWKDQAKWFEKVKGTVADRRAQVLDQATDSDPMHPARAVAEVAKSINPKTIVCADGALSYLWLSEVMSSAQPAGFMCHGYLGSMGIGMGIALGAQAAAADKRVLLVTGDGAVGYSLAEFDTMTRNQLPVVVVILNNSAWGATLHFQQLFVGGDRITKTRLNRSHYEDVAKALGASGVYVTKAEDIHSAIEAAFESKQPTCINVQVALDPVPPEEMILLGQNPFKKPA
jgi:acetolactate synthase-1/2/3 large subunit